MGDFLAFRQAAAYSVFMTGPERVNHGPVQVSATVAAQIRAFRIKRELSVRQLAELCAKHGAPQLTEASLGNIERGQDPSARRKPRDVSVDELLVLAYVLNARPAELMFGRGSEPVEAAPGVHAHPYVAWGWLVGMLPLADLWGPRIKDEGELSAPNSFWGWFNIDQAYFMAYNVYIGLARAKESGGDVAAAQERYDQALNRLGLFLADSSRDDQTSSLPPMPKWMVDDLREYDAKNRIRMHGQPGGPHPDQDADGFIYPRLPRMLPTFEEERPQ